MRILAYSNHNLEQPLCVAGFECFAILALPAGYLSTLSCDQHFLPSLATSFAVVKDDATKAKRTSGVEQSGSGQKRMNMTIRNV